MPLDARSLVPRPALAERVRRRSACLVTAIARPYPLLGQASGGREQWVYSTYSTGCSRARRGPASQRAIRRRNVADDHGDPGTARLQGGLNISVAASPAQLRHRCRHQAIACPAAEWVEVLAICLKGGLGGLLAGGAAGSVISGGLGELLKQFQQNGQGEVANSWVAPGPNKQISPNDLASALGADQIDTPGVAKRPVARRITCWFKQAFARG